MSPVYTPKLIPGMEPGVVIFFGLMPIPMSGSAYAPVPVPAVAYDPCLVQATPSTECTVSATAYTEKLI